MTITARSHSLVGSTLRQPELGQLGHVRIVVGDIAAARAQQLEDLQRRRLAQVAHARLVADPDEQDPRAVDGLAHVVERALDLLQAEVGHLLVDLAGELDELGRHVVLARLPGQVERIDRQAVATHPGARLEAHEAERLGRRGVDDLPDVDPHPVRQDRQLVDERDVDRAEDVLQQLGQLRDLRRGDGDERLAHAAVEVEGSLGALACEAADELGRVADREVRAAGIDALGREREREVLARVQTRLLQQRHQMLARRAGEGGRLEHDELALADHAGQRLGGGEQRSEVGLAVAVERRGDADEDRLGLVQLDGAGGEGEAGLRVP